MGSSIAGIAGDFSDTLAAIDEDRLLIGAGVGFGSGRVSGVFRYDGSFGTDSVSHRGTVGVSVGF